MSLFINLIFPISHNSKNFNTSLHVVYKGFVLVIKKGPHEFFAQFRLFVRWTDLVFDKPSVQICSKCVTSVLLGKLICFCSKRKVFFKINKIRITLLHRVSNSAKVSQNYFYNFTLFWRKIRSIWGLSRREY